MNFCFLSGRPVKLAVDEFILKKSPFIETEEICELKTDLLDMMTNMKFNEKKILKMMNFYTVS